MTHPHDLDPMETTAEVDVPSCVYEDPILRDALGDVLRPGGLALTDEAIAACNLRSNARVLDAGCGAGATVTHIRSHHGLAAFGIDASRVLLAAGHSREPSTPLVRSRGERLPLADGSVDAMLSECSLSVMSDIDAALAEFGRVLRPSGRLVLADIYVRNLEDSFRPSGRRPSSCLEGAMPKMQIMERLADHGFACERWEDRSDALKVMAARLILAGAPPEQFWGSACAGASGTPRSKPGYYWLIARKVADARA